MAAENQRLLSRKSRQLKTTALKIAPTLAHIPSQRIVYVGRRIHRHAGVTKSVLSLLLSRAFLLDDGLVACRFLFGLSSLSYWSAVVAAVGHLFPFLNVGLLYSC